MFCSLMMVKLGIELVVSGLIGWAFKYKDKGNCNRCCCAWSDLLYGVGVATLGVWEYWLTANHSCTFLPRVALRPCEFSCLEKEDSVKSLTPLAEWYGVTKAQFPYLKLEQHQRAVYAKEFSVGSDLGWISARKTLKLLPLPYPASLPPSKGFLLRAFPW